MRPREQQCSPHIHTEHLLNSLEDNWNDKHKTLVIFIKSTLIYLLPKGKNCILQQICVGDKCGHRSNNPISAFYCVHIVKKYSCCSRKILLWK